MVSVGLTMAVITYKINCIVFMFTFAHLAAALVYPLSPYSPILLLACLLASPRMDRRQRRQPSSFPSSGLWSSVTDVAFGSVLKRLRQIPSRCWRELFSINPSDKQSLTLWKILFVLMGNKVIQTTFTLNSLQVILPRSRFFFLPFSEWPPPVHVVPTYIIVYNY